MKITVEPVDTGYVEQSPGTECGWAQLTVSLDGLPIGTVEVGTTVMHRLRDGKNEITISVAGSLDQDKIIVGGN